MRDLDQFPRVKLGVFPTPLYRLEAISAKYGRNIWIKRDDLCGVALGGNKVRKLEYLLAQAQTQGCDTVFTTGGAQSNHAMLTAACAARLGMRCILLLKKRGVTDHRGNLILDDIYGAQVRSWTPTAMTISTRRWTVLAQSWPQRAAGPITFPLEVPQPWAPWGM